MNNEEKVKIITELENLLGSLNSTSNYNLALLLRLARLEKRIKRFVIDNTAINKDIRIIYRKFSPGIYFITVYAFIRDFEKALAGYKMTELYGGFIQYTDLFYEHPKNERFKRLAYKFRAAAIRNLKPKVTRQVLKAEKDFVSKYSRFEIRYKHLLKSGYKFTDSEIERFIFLKAKSIVGYPIILKQYCRVPQNLINLINYNQAIYNFYDDYWDLKEDLHDKAPNTFIFALLSDRRLTSEKLKGLTRNQLISIIKRRGTWVRLQRIADRFRTKAEKINVPENYRFWRFLPRFNFEFFYKYFDSGK